MRRLGFFGLALLAALILGFLAKRVMIPSAVHYIADRPPDRSQTITEANPPTASNDSSAPQNTKSNTGSEQLTPSDRRALDAIIKRKGKVTGN